MEFFCRGRGADADVAGAVEDGDSGGSSADDVEFGNWSGSVDTDIAGGVFYCQLICAVIFSKLNIAICFSIYVERNVGNGTHKVVISVSYTSAKPDCAVVGTGGPLTHGDSASTWAFDFKE